LNFPYYAAYMNCKCILVKSKCVIKMLTLREIHQDEYYSLYSKMKQDFPSGELAPFFTIKRNLERKIYNGYYLSDNLDLGYAIITAPQGLKYALLNYFAIYPEYRSKGYGSEFLKILINHYHERILVLEAEDPQAQKNSINREIAKHRINFYERAGFRVAPTAKAKIFGVNMLIMTNGHEENFSARKAMHALYLPAFDSEHWLRFIDVRD